MTEITKAQRIAAAIAKLEPKRFTALQAFAQGQMVSGLVREARLAEGLKTSWLANKQITSQTYQDLIWLDRFFNDQLDDGLRTLQTLLCR